MPASKVTPCTVWLMVSPAPSAKNRSPCAIDFSLTRSFRWIGDHNTSPTTTKASVGLNVCPAKNWVSGRSTARSNGVTNSDASKPKSSPG